MGKGLIIESLGSGKYKIQYQFETSGVDRRKAEIDAQIAELTTNLIPAQQTIVDAANISVNNAKTALDVAITSGIRDDIREATLGLRIAEDFRNKSTVELSSLKMELLSFTKMKEGFAVYELKPETREVWCADLNVGLSGEVGTIEVVNERTHDVIIKPAGEVGTLAKYDGGTDGIMGPALNNSPWGWLWNKIKKPGHQKWMSKYRIGTIRKFNDLNPNACDLDLDEAFSTEQGLNVNHDQETRLYDIPIHYMECNEEVFKIGDRVVIEYDTEPRPFTAWRVIGFETNPRPCGLVFITYIGEDTITYDRRYYRLKKGLLEETEELSSWNLTDDGLYSVIFTGTSYDNPDLYAYRTTPEEGDGMRIPETFTGVDAKLQDENNLRFMTNQTQEEETWTAFIVGGTPSYNYLNPLDSLIRAPYKIISRGSTVCRYSNESGKAEDLGIITANKIFQAGIATIRLESWDTNSFGDAIPVINRMQQETLDGTKTFIDLTVGNPIKSAIAAIVNKFPGLRGLVPLLRGDAFTVGLAKLAEPIEKEVYSMGDSVEEDFGGPLPGYPAQVFHRSADGVTDGVYMLDANTIYGKVVDENGYTTESGQQFISNDITLPHAMSYKGSLTYIRKQKDTEFTLHNAGLYVSDTLIEESGFEEVIKLYEDDVLPAEFNGPLLIRKTDYQILQAYHDDVFDAILYRKVTYQSHDNDLLPYTTTRTMGESTFTARFRRTNIISKAEYKIAVNGKITELPYSHTLREYKLTVLSEEYPFYDLTWVPFFALGGWFDVGYDENGTATGEDNKQVARSFMSKATNQLLIAFDIYPISFRHILKGTDGLLRPDFDETITPFPPELDARYETPSGRRWMLFGETGELTQDIPAPTDNRVNGIAMIDPRGQ